MSIKAVDFQVMLPKTSEVSKLHNDEQHKNQALQQQQATTIQNKAEERIRQVHTQDQIHQAKIREKEEKERRDKKEEKRRNKGNYGNSKEKEPDMQESIIDIRL